MKKSILITLALLFLTTAAVGAEPFAPKADPPADPSAPEAQLAVMYLQGAEVPDRKEVGIPAYPGARITQAAENVMNGLSRVVLLSEDPPAEVRGFLRK